MKFSDRTLETKTFKIPILWFWVYRVGKNEILDAINVWYRHIDTAQYYKNEEQVWQAIKVSWIDRKEFFITTKVVTEWYDNTLKWIDISLQKLWYDYYDLILIHRPLWDDISIYKVNKYSFFLITKICITYLRFFASVFFFVCHPFQILFLFL